jgi:hypothetical protein
MTKSPKKKLYKSPLEKYPKHVQAIGMISIEHASLESMLAELLGAVIGVYLPIGTTLFYTPKSSIARLELISNVAPETMGRNPELLRQIKAVIKRSKAVMGKRHDIIHSLWAETDHGGYPVARITFPHWGGGEVPITVLSEVIRDYRQLIEEVGPLVNAVQKARGLGYFPHMGHVPFPETPE